MGTEYTAFIEKAVLTATTQATPNDLFNSNDPFGEAEPLVVGTDPRKPQWKSSWEAPIALLFTSIHWWENYVDRDIKLGCFKIPFATYKRHLQSVRSKVNIGASLWKIALTITFSIVLLPSGKFENVFVKSHPQSEAPSVTSPPLFQADLLKSDSLHYINKRQLNDNFFASTVPSVLNSMAMPQIDDFTVPNNAFESPTTPQSPYDFTTANPMTAKWKTISPFIPFIIHFFSTALCYYFAKSSCKMCMQRIAFALPLTLATPLTIGIYLGVCSNGLGRIQFIKDMMYWECSEQFEKGSLKWQLIFGLGLWWLSEVWIAMHAWFPQNKRLAATEQLFVLPQYEAALIEQSLLLNRRRNEKEHLKQKLEEHFEDMDIIDGI